jgi:hypothetical protein
MHILLKGVEKEKCLNLLMHLRKQKLNVLERSQSVLANEELVQIDCIINNIDVNPPVVVQIYEKTWKEYTPTALKEDIVVYTNSEWEQLNIKSYEIFTDHIGNEINVGDSVFIYYEDCGAVISKVERFTTKGVMLNVPNKTEERSLHKDHSHRILKVN